MKRVTTCRHNNETLNMYLHILLVKFRHITDVPTPLHRLTQVILKKFWKRKLYSCFRRMRSSVSFEIRNYATHQSEIIQPSLKVMDLWGQFMETGVTHAFYYFNLLFLCKYCLWLKYIWLIELEYIEFIWRLFSFQRHKK